MSTPLRWSSPAPRWSSLSRPRLALAPLAALLLAIATLLGASPATAVDGQIAHVEPTDGGVDVLVSVPAEAEPRTKNVTATVDGEDVEATAAPAGDGELVRRTAVLAIDTSNSMEGPRFAAAQQAARTFLAAVPADVYVGIVTFDSEVDPALEPTLDREAAVDVVDGLSLSKQTLLYDGVVAATDLAGEEGQRSVLVLSDGADTSETTLADATAAVTDAGVLLDVVALDQETDVEALQSLAAAGDGQVIPATADALNAAFAAEADVLARQVQVSLTLPDGFEAETATIAVSLPSPTGPITASAFTSVRGDGGTPGTTGGSDGGPGAVETGSAWQAPGWVMYAGLAVFGLGLLVALLILLVPAAEKPLSVAERLALYGQATGTTLGRPQAAEKERDPALDQVKAAAADVLSRNRGLEQRISASLTAAGSGMKASEWLLFRIATLVIAAAFGLLLGGVVTTLLLLVVAAVAPWAYLRVQRTRRRRAFNAALPDTLQLMSGSLAAGLSLAQSVDTVTREGQDPIAEEFKRVLVETRLGVSLEDAFDGVAERFDSKDFAWVVMAIRIQRTVGGNLAELLNTVADTMREREYLRRQVASLAAEGKISSYVLAGLPPFFLIFLQLTNPEFIEPLFTVPLGQLMFGGGVVWMAIGIFWMSRLTKVEV